MPQRPITFRKFGGLVLNLPLDEVGPENAIDLLDVDWGNSTGRLRSREGSAAFSSGAAATNYNALFAHSHARLLSRRGSTLYSINTEGEEIAGKNTAVNELHLSFARLGTPAASYTYIADGEGIQRYDGTDFTTPTCTLDGAAGKAMPKAKFLAVWPDGGNRLVSIGTPAGGGPGGAISSSSHVWFSEPGNAEGYENTAFVQCSPGDGEDFIGGCFWGGMIFAFKETKLFVFYGVSADAEGRPIFNFRTIQLGTRLAAPAVTGGELIVAGTDSVYFVAKDGVYATSGGEPNLISTDLEPLALSQPLVGPAATTLGERRWTDAAGITYLNDCLYVGLQGAGSSIDRVLKFDLRKQGWTIYTASLFAMTPWIEQGSERPRIYFSGAGAGNKQIYLYTDEEERDATVAMNPYWQSGFYDLEIEDEKTLVDTKLWGSGEVEVNVGEDFKAAEFGKKFKLGEAPAIAQHQQKLSQTASLFSHRVSGEPAWEIERIARYLREERVPATQKRS